jgi:Leucine-rich repeat (LRR) protein
VSNNAIQEDANDLLEDIPPNMVQYIASNNQIYGNLPDSLNNLQKLRQFNMASNALSGALPGFTESFVTLQELDLSNQTYSFTGSIPEAIWRSLSLTKLNLAGNKLTGSVPRAIGNMAVLEEFDVSNNSLDSSLPTELGMLDGK